MRQEVQNYYGRGGGGDDGMKVGNKGDWTIYDTSNNLVRGDWSSMINRSLANLGESSAGLEYNEHQAGPTLFNQIIFVLQDFKLDEKQLGKELYSRLNKISDFD